MVSSLVRGLLNGRNQYKQKVVKDINKNSNNNNNNNKMTKVYVLSILPKVVRCKVRYVGFVIEVVRRFLSPKIPPGQAADKGCPARKYARPQGLYRCPQ